MTQIAIDTELSAINSILGSIGQAPTTAINATNPEHAFVQNLLREANIDVQNEGWHFNTEYHKPATLDSNGYIPIETNILRFDISDGQSFRTQDVVRRTLEVLTIDATYTMSSSGNPTLATINSTSHGLSVGDIITINFSGDGAYLSGTYSVHSLPVSSESNNIFFLAIPNAPNLQSSGLTCTYYLGTSKYKLYNLVDHTFVFSGEILLDITYLVQFTDLPPVFQRYVTSRAASRAAAQLVSNPELVKLLQNQEALTRASVMEYETQQGDHSYMGWGHNTSYSSYQPYKALRR